METRAPRARPDDLTIDLRGDDEDGERWLTVTEAAELVGIDSSTIRGWYRSGRIPSQRTEGDHGAYLVPLSAILRLGVVDAPAADDIIDLDADLDDDDVGERSALRRALDDARRQVDFLRQQLAESAAGERAATARAEAAEAEVARLRAGRG